MEIPGIYSPQPKLDTSRFFSPKEGAEPASQQLGLWRTWNGTECARFIADVCMLPQYGDVAERNLSGAFIDELLQAGLLSKGLARIGIGDFEHVRQITVAIQKLDFGGRMGVTLSASQGKSGWQSATAPRKRPPATLQRPQSTTALPKLRTTKPKLLEQVTIQKPISYVFDGRHSPTVMHLRKAVLNRADSEGAIRTPYWTSGRNSPEPWGGLNEGVPNLVTTRDEFDTLRPKMFVSAFDESQYTEGDVTHENTKNDDLLAKMEFLAKVPLLRRLPKDQMPILAGMAVTRKYAEGLAIVTQGKVGHEFFVIVSGTADVLNEGRPVATLSKGDYFGEKALLHDELRAATVTAKTAVECLEIHRDKFRELGLHHKLHFANRKAVAGGDKKILAKEPSPKTAEERQVILDGLKGNVHLNHTVTLDNAMLNKLVDIAWKEEVPEGTELIKHGDIHAHYFYVVQEGDFQVLVPPKVQALREKAPHNLAWALHADELQHVVTIGKSGSFGEMALLYSAPRAATVKAGSKAVVWVIDRKNFKNIMKTECKVKIRDYCECLDKVEMLASLYKDEKEAVAEALVEMQFEKGQAIMQKQRPANALYLLYEGEVTVDSGDGSGTVTVLKASPSAHTTHSFGEKCLLAEEGDVNAMDVQVTSASAKFLVLDRETFTHLLGPLKDIMGGVHQGIHSTMDSSSEKTTGRIFRKDLEKRGLLGCGGFGEVNLVEHIPSGATYALKAVSKGYIVEQYMEDCILNEKAICMMVNSPFIINMHECFNGSQYLYILLDAALGGELFATYMHHGFAGSEPHGKFYSASVVYALEYLHERHIIYRDLKPENLLLTSDGYLKLTDMGLSKFVFGKSYTCCGTPDYFSPEMIHAVGHTNSTDWWTLGILIYELMAGYPPFEADSPWETYDKVFEGIRSVWFPPECEGAVADLICNLLEHEPELRLPMRPGGTSNIKTHPWYAGFDWEALRNLTMAPPYMPEVKGATDMSNFDDWDVHLPIQIPYVDDGSGWELGFATVDEPDYPASEPPEWADEFDMWDEFPDLDQFCDWADDPDFLDYARGDTPRM